MRTHLPYCGPTMPDCVQANQCAHPHPPTPHPPARAPLILRLFDVTLADETEAARSQMTTDKDRFAILFGEEVRGIGCQGAERTRRDGNPIHPNPNGKTYKITQSS